MLDLANQFGDGGARRVFQAVVQDGMALGDLCKPWPMNPCTHAGCVEGGYASAAAAFHRRPPFLLIVH